MTEISFVDLYALIGRLDTHLKRFTNAVRAGDTKTAEYEQGYYDAAQKIARNLLDYQKGKERMLNSELQAMLKRLPDDAIVFIQDSTEIKRQLKAARIRVDMEHSQHKDKGSVMAFPAQEVTLRG